MSDERRKQSMSDSELMQSFPETWKSIEEIKSMAGGTELAMEIFKHIEVLVQFRIRVALVGAADEAEDISNKFAEDVRMDESHGAGVVADMLRRKAGGDRIMRRIESALRFERKV